MVDENVSRLDLVWDIYRADSIKQAAQNRRGDSDGIRTSVSCETPIPKDWRKFLQVKDNKTELFKFLAQQLVEKDMGVKVYSTYYEDNVIVKDVKNCGSLDFLMPCNHQEADSRLFLHLFDASERQGHRKALIKTVDSDVPVIAIGVFKSLKLEELYIEMGTSRAEVKIIPIHEVVNTLGPENLRLYHCSTASQGVTAHLRFSVLERKLLGESGNLSLSSQGHLMSLHRTLGYFHQCLFTWSNWSVLLFFYTAKVRVAARSMKPEKCCFLMESAYLMGFHRHKTPYTSISGGHFYKQLSFGANVYTQNNIFPT